MFWTRLGSGIVLLLLSITTMGIGGLPLAVILWIISLIGFRELTRAFKNVPPAQSGALQPQGGKRVNVLEAIGLAGISAYYLLLYLSGSHTCTPRCCSPLSIRQGCVPRVNMWSG